MRKVGMLVVAVSFLAICTGSARAGAETWKDLLARADSLSRTQYQDSAIFIGKLALGNTRADFGGNDTASARVLQRLGWYHWCKADYGKADSLFRQALAILEEAFGPDHPEVAQCFEVLALSSNSQLRFADAEALLKRALAIREKAQGPDHPDVTLPLKLLARLYSVLARYADAEVLLKRALAIREKAQGPDHPDVAQCLDAIARNCWDQLRFADAEALLKRALAIQEKAQGRDHPDVAMYLGNLASLFAYQARYADAEPPYKRSLAILKKTLGPDAPIVASALNSLACVYLEQARYSDAEPLLRRALSVWEKYFDPDDQYHRAYLNKVAIEHPPIVYFPDEREIGESLNNLALVYLDLGRRADAESLLKRALAVQERANGPDDPFVASSLNCLARVYLEQSRYSDAESLSRRALAICEKALRPRHLDVADGLNQLAIVYSEQARYVDAELLNKRALAILEKALGPDHPLVASSLNSLARVYLHQARYADAEPLYKRALAIYEEALGPDHPEVATTLNGLAKDYRATQQFGLGVTMAAKAFNIRLRNFRDNAYVLSEKDALTYSQAVRKASGGYLSYFVDIGTVNPERLAEACCAVLESKGIVSDGVMERQQALAAEKDSVTLALVESHRGARLQISKLYSAGPGDDTIGAYKKELDSLAQVANNLEAELSRHSSSFQRRQDIKNITVARIVSVLPINSSFVEYLKWNYHQLKPDSLIPRYLALIVDKGGEPEIVDLGDASEIDTLVDRYREHMLRVSIQKHMPLEIDKREYEEISESLYAKVWQPLEDKIAGKELVFVAPDGGLNLVSFAGLQDAEGKYLVEKYALHYLSAGRDLIRLKDQPGPATGLFALGDPDYDASPVARKSGDVGSHLAAVLSTDQYTTRNVRSGCGDLREMKVSSLPGTHKEVEEVVTSWRSGNPGLALAYFGSNASEDAFKQDAPGKRAIHLATHGYYLEGRCQPKLPQMRFGLDEGFVGENPLLLSGLLLAGANLHGARADSLDVEDGILTAQEVSAMNLEGTQLVVLSACESGLGKVANGEGVYGLRRAFQMAGARTVVSALWPVSDRMTSEMMIPLYASSSNSLPQRMREMQLTQIKKLRSQGLPDHPYSWAAFVALGDWR